MSEKSLLSKWRSLKKDMENMTCRQKLEHLWTYYKWVLWVMLAVILCVSMLLTGFQNKRKIMLLGGVTVNVQLSEEGKAYLSEDYKQIIGTGNKRETVTLSHTDIGDVTDPMAYEENYYAVMGLLTQCLSEDADYLILDQAGFDAMLVQGVYLGLDQIYTPEQLEEMGEDLVYAQNKGAESPSALALDITDCAFIQEHANVSGPVYFVYVVSSPRLEACRELYDYLLAYQ